MWYGMCGVNSSARMNHEINAPPIIVSQSMSGGPEQRDGKAFEDRGGRQRVARLAPLGCERRTRENVAQRAPMGELDARVAPDGAAERRSAGVRQQRRDQPRHASD